MTVIDPKSEIRGFVERGYLAQARELLAQLTEDQVRSDPELLLLRIRASETTLLDPGDRSDGISRDFDALLAHPAATALQLLSAANRSVPALRRSLGRRLARWVMAFPARCEPWGIATILEDVPLSVWPADALVLAFDQALASHAGDVSHRRFLERMKRVAPHDSRFPEMTAAAARRDEQVRAHDQAEAAARLAQRPGFAAVEATFGIVLPPHLRRAWEAFYAGERPELRFLAVRADNLDELTRRADLAQLEHEELRAGGDSRYAVLPFAEGHDDADVVALDLRCPDGNGDFPVLWLVHDDPDGVQRIFRSSAEWLARGGRFRRAPVKRRRR